MKTGRERLREWIDRSKLNQTETAALLGMHPVMLSQILSGVRSPGLTTAVTIEDVTGVAVRSWGLSRVSKAPDADPAPSQKRQLTKR